MRPIRPTWGERRKRGEPDVAYQRKLRRLLPLRHQVIDPDVTIDLGQYAAFPAGYRPSNPSIIRHGDGFLVCVRGVCYRINERLNYVTDADGNVNSLPPLNRFFLLGNDLNFQRAVPTPQKQLDAVEDLKLFSGLGRAWGVGWTRIDDPRQANACAVTLVEFDPGLTGCRLIPLGSPLGFPIEKNWAPFFVGDVLHFMYSCEPTILLRCEPASGALTFVGSRPPRRASLMFLEGGSSGGIATPSGTIFLTHRRVVRLPSRRRIYLSRIRHLSRDLTRVAAGPFFSIGHPTIQFANGMLREEKRILITYGEMDSAARLACIARGRFERAVFPHQ